MTDFEKALNSNLEGLLLFAQSKLNSPQLAADAVQDSLVKALIKQDSLKDDEKIRSWLYQILRNTINDLYRSNSKNKIDTIDTDKIIAEDEIDRLACRCIEKLLPTMNDDYAFLIRELELNQKAVKEIAKELKIKPENLKVKRFRARQQLKQRLEETCQLCAAHGCINCDCDQN